MNFKKAALALVLCMAVALTGCISKVVAVEDVSKYVQLGQYKGVSYTPVDTTVTQEQHDSAVEQLLSGFATSTQITSGVVENGDTVNINFTGLENGVKFENGSAEDQTLVLGSGGFIPGFEEGIVGHSIGESFMIDVVFPADYHAAEMAGKAVQFEILINYKVQYDYPELTDEFVATNFNTETVSVTTVDAFHAWVDEQLLASNESAAQSAKVGAVWQAVLDNATIIELPKSDVDTYYNNLYAQQEAMAAYYSQMYGSTITLDTLINDMYGMSKEEFEAELRLQAENTCKEALVTEAIAFAEGLNITDAELKTGAAEIAAQYSLADANEALESYGKETIFMALLQEKVLALVTESAVAAN